MINNNNNNNMVTRSKMKLISLALSHSWVSPLQRLLVRLLNLSPARPQALTFTAFRFTLTELCPSLPKALLSSRSLKWCKRPAQHNIPWGKPKLPSSSNNCPKEELAPRPPRPVWIQSQTFICPDEPRKDQRLP